MNISGFSFGHNLLKGGYPFVEMIKSIHPFVDDFVIVDMESNDGTREVLESLGVTIIDGKWGDTAGEVLKAAHALHTECKHDIIIHAESDEIFDAELLLEIRNQIYQGHYNLAVHRLQLEQNFQRCRWYPELVHRVFPKGTVVKNGHTTEQHDNAKPIRPEYGFLWDITNCFKTQWLNRIKQQAEMRKEEMNLLAVPIHTVLNSYLPDEKSIEDFLNQPHWNWTETPFDIPDILKHLVGQDEYKPYI